MNELHPFEFDKNNFYPLKFDKVEEGKKTGKLQGMPLFFRKIVYDKIVELLPEIEKSVESKEQWQVKILDQDDGTDFLFFYFKDDGYMVIIRTSTYDLDKKEMLPDDKDTVMVFRFKTLDDLIKKYD